MVRVSNASEPGYNRFLLCDFADVINELKEKYCFSSHGAIDEFVNAFIPAINAKLKKRGIMWRFARPDYWSGFVAIVSLLPSGWIVEEESDDRDV